MSLSLPLRVSSLSLGFEHTLLLTDSLQVFSFGRNPHGQLGLPLLTHTSTPVLVDFPHRVKQVRAGVRWSLLVTEEAG